MPENVFEKSFHKMPENVFDPRKFYGAPKNSRKNPRDRLKDEEIKR